MRRVPPILPRILVTVVFLGALGYIVFSFGTISRVSRNFSVGAAAVGPGASKALPHTKLAPADPDEERNRDKPAQVGDARAENFLRKVEPRAPIPAEGTIVLTDETFSAAYDELYDERDKYYGRTVDLAGIVMSQDDLEPGEFLVGRKLMWCCENDTYFIGFLAYVDGEAPKEGSRIRVRGLLEPRKYRNAETGKIYDVPAIRVERIDPEEGVSVYVYPSSPGG